MKTRQDKEKEIALNDFAGLAEPKETDIQICNKQTPQEIRVDIDNDIEKKVMDNYIDFLKSEEGKDIRECFDKIESIIDKYPTDFELQVNYELLSYHGKVLFDKGHEIQKERNKNGIYNYLKKMTQKMVNALAREDHKDFEVKKKEVLQLANSMEMACNDVDGLKNLYRNKVLWNK